MITAYEVGALFKIIDEATGPIKKILEQVKALGAEIKTVQEQLKIVGTGGTAIAELSGLAAAWGGVATEMKAAAAQMTAAAAAGSRAGAAAAVGRPPGAVPIVPSAGGGGRFRGRGGGVGTFGPGGHIYAPGIPLGGGAHYRAGGAGGTVGLIGALLGYEALERASEVGEAAWLAQFHLEGGKTTPGMLERIKKDIQEVSSTTGFPVKDVGHAFEDIFRQTQGIGGDREGFAKEVVKAASAEARLKGTSITEAASSLTGFAHQFRDYDIETFKKVLPYIEYLSTTDPRSLKRMMTAGGYAIPTAIEAGVSPMEAVELGAVMAAAGITNTKTGTWLRSYIQGGLGVPVGGLTPLKAAKGRELGILDENDKSTVLNPDGSLNVTKLQQTIYEHTRGMSPADKVGAFQKYFGAQGAGLAELLNDPVIAQRIKELGAIKDERAAGFAGFQTAFNEQSPLQRFRLALADLNVVLADIGSVLLTAVLPGLKGLDEALKGIHGVMGPGTAANAAVGGALGGAAVGGVAGAFGATSALPFLGAGIMPGVAGGAAVGAAGAGLFWGLTSGLDKFEYALGHAADYLLGLFGNKTTPSPGATEEDTRAKKMNFLQGPPPQGQTSSAQGGNVYLDAKKVGDIVMDQIAERSTRPGEGSAFYDSTHGSPTQDQSYSYG